MTRAFRTRALVRLGVLAAALVATGGLALSASADSHDPTVTTEVKEPDRNLEVLDLTGQQLDELALRDGQPEAFETRVTDTHQDPNNNYQVDATMNNLHRVTTDGHSADDVIPSSAIDLDFARQPRVVDPIVDLDPTATLGTVDPISCNLVSETLNLTGTLTELVSSDPICGLLDDLFGALNLSLSGDDGVTFADATLDNVLIEAIDLSDLPIDTLPLAARTGEPGSFTEPECASGIGATFCSNGGATALQTMVVDSHADPLDSALESELVAQLPSETETVTNIVQAMQSSNDDLIDESDNVVGTVGDLGDAIAEYSESEQTTLVTDLIDFSWDTDTLGVDNLTHFSGRNSTRPTLTVDTGDAPGGEYEGTLTVTLTN